MKKTLNLNESEAKLIKKIVTLLHNEHSSVFASNLVTSEIRDLCHILDKLESLKNWPKEEKYESTRTLLVE